MPNKLLCFSHDLAIKFDKFLHIISLTGVNCENKKTAVISGFQNLVPRDGLEPSHLAAGDFESPASTNFATWASEEDAL